MLNLNNINNKVQLIYNLFEPWFCTIDTATSVSITFSSIDAPGFVTSTNQIFINFGYFLDKYRQLNDAQLNWKLVFVITHELSHINQNINIDLYLSDKNYYTNIEGGNNFNVYKTIFNNMNLLSLLPFPIEYFDSNTLKKSAPDMMYEKYIYLAKNYQSFYELKAIDSIIKIKMHQLKIPINLIEDALSSPILYLKFPEILIPIKLNNKFVCNKFIIRLLNNKVLECKKNKIYPIEIFRG